MCCKRFYFSLFIVFFFISAIAQDSTLEVKKLFVEADTIVHTYSNQIDSVEIAERISSREYFHLLKEDFISQVKSPITSTSKQWKKAAWWLSGVSIALMADRGIGGKMQEWKQQSTIVQKWSPRITHLGSYTGLFVLGAVGLTGVISRNKKLKTTVLLSAQSFITASAWTLFFKSITGRSRPDFLNHWRGPGYFFKAPADVQKSSWEYNSFPSGHTSTIFSIATVFARQYKNKPLIAIACYTTASLVGLTRIIENRHWASDVIAGAGLGYFCGTVVMNNFKKLAQKKAGMDRKRSVNFDTLLSGNSAHLYVNF